MVKDHLDSGRGNPLLPLDGLLFYMHRPQDRIAHTKAIVATVMEITPWVHLKDRSDDPSHHERTLYHGATSRSCLHNNEVTNSYWE